MLSVQQMLDIAFRHATRMADAMVAACVEWSLRAGVVLADPERPRPDRRAPRGRLPEEDVDWRRMVEGNSDSRWTHV